MASKFCIRTLTILSDLVQFHSAFMLACYFIFNLVFSVVAVLANLLVIVKNRSPGAYFRNFTACHVSRYIDGLLKKIK